ncbi:MAG: 2-amino-4-hydroxy-6-hydroxymethyldihydropteridine diphosphokinase [Acidobacteriota bacterium]|nr:2-amino-4-hydroxy-6-hydroxymethyldihydropteridine diphosphokinase [Acidobacteriota bacterium]
MDGAVAPPTLVAIALGSNLGDREAHLAFAVGRLAALLTNLRQSTWHDNAAIGVTDQPRYLNGVVVGTTTLTPRELLDRLLAIEREDGRERPARWAARTLDLDLILYGSARLAQPGLVVPHPRFRERLFVLEPLADLEPGWVDPVSGVAVSELLQRARQRLS